MISKTAVHALNAVVELAGLPENEYCGAAKLADHIRAPQNYLGKLLQTLSQAGVVLSQKGMGGGFRLARRAEEIRLLDVVDPIDHISKWSRCLMSQDNCSEDHPCAMHTRWAVVRDAYFKMLTDSTIADVARRKNGHGGNAH